MHKDKLPTVIELEARYALCGSGDCRFCKFSQLASINKGLQDVLLYVEIGVVDGRHGLAVSGKVPSVRGFATNRNHGNARAHAPCWRSRAAWIASPNNLSIRIEEADDPLRLLERLNQPIEQNAVETR
jgi:hypothetical protein